MPDASEPSCDQRFRLPCAAGAGLALLLAAAAPASSGESVYTELDTDECEVLERYEESGGIELRCAGHDGVPVFVSDGDARMDVDYGVRNQDFQTFSPFNSVGRTVEWRIADGRPFAAILRYHLDSGVTGGAEDRAEALVVSSVGDEGAPGCVTAVVDASIEQANGVARGAAAFAPRHDCATEPPIIIAPAGSLVSSMGGAVAEGQ